jgi:hypothetical protein
MESLRDRVPVGLDRLEYDENMNRMDDANVSGSSGPTALLTSAREGTAMAERSAAERLGQIRELEISLLVSMSEAHRYGVCDADGRHTAECIAFFEILGWGSYEEFQAAVEAGALSRVAGRA